MNCFIGVFDFYSGSQQPGKSLILTFFCHIKFKEKYRDLYGKDVKSHIDRRFKDEQRLHEQLDSYTPLMSLLSERYGIEDGNVAKIMEAIDNDDSFWEEQALKENMTVDQLKRMRKTEAQNRQLVESAQRAQQIRQRDDIYARWDREAELCKQHFPEFDMEKNVRMRLLPGCWEPE